MVHNTRRRPCEFLRGVHGNPSVDTKTILNRIGPRKVHLTLPFALTVSRWMEVQQKIIIITGQYKKGRPASTFWVFADASKTTTVREQHPRLG